MAPPPEIRALFASLRNSIFPLEQVEAGTVAEQALAVLPYNDKF